MKIIFTILTFIISGFLFAKNKVGGTINVSAYVDKNCNKIADKDEIINTGGYTVTVVGGNYSKTETATSFLVEFTNLQEGTYTATATYNYTFPNGTSKMLTAVNTAAVTLGNITNVTLLFDGCYTPPAPTNGTVTVYSYLDKNCNKRADKDELLSESHKVKLSGFGYANTKYPRNAMSVYENVSFGNYTATGTYDFTTPQRRKHELKATTAVSHQAEAGTTVSLLFDPCEALKDTTPIEPPVPTDVCGRWLNDLLQTSTNDKVTGNYNLTNTRESLVIGILKTTVRFNGSYKWFWEKKSGACKITGTIVKPNGEKTSWSDDFSLQILQPGTYTITYQVKCQERICEAGVKTIICTDVIVCNCGPVNDRVTVYTGSGKSRSTKIYRNGDSILIDKALRFLIDYDVKCEGNICDGLATYTLVDGFGKNISGYSLDRSDFKNLLGNYTLKVTGSCGGKNCANLSFPVRVYGVPKQRVEVSSRARWGNQIGVNFGWPRFDDFAIEKGYIGFMVGTIADLPLGRNSRWHIWPAVNLATANYKGQKILPAVGVTSMNIKTPHLMYRLGADLSYAFPLNNKGANFHLYAGLSFDGTLWNKQKVTTNPTAYANTWLTANANTNTDDVYANLNAGILVDLNRKWTIGANYYTYRIDKNTKIYTPLRDHGLSLRLAWFYNQTNGVRR